MRFDDLASRLAAAPFGELPGAEAQGRLAPRPRRAWVPGLLPADARPAAGLALVYPSEGDAVLLLTVRGSSVPRHGGQVSLPGGALEPGEAIEDAALREAHEEVGLAPEAVVVRGRLTPLHIPVSGYVLHPVVATSESRPSLKPQSGEVARLVEVGIDTLASPASWRVERREIDGGEIEIPSLDLGGPRLWGATAMIISELLALLGVPVDPWIRAE